MSAFTLSTIRQNLSKFNFNDLSIPALVLLIMGMLVIPLHPVLLRSVPMRRLLKPKWQQPHPRRLNHGGFAPAVKTTCKPACRQIRRAAAVVTKLCSYVLSLHLVPRANRLKWQSSMW